MVQSVYSFVVKILTAVTNGFAAVSQKLLGVKSELDDIKATLQEQGKQIARILAAVTPGPTASAVVTFYLDGQIFEGKTMILKDSQTVSFTITPTDKEGKPSAIDPTKTVVTADQPGVAIVKINPDGLGGTVQAGTIGTANLTGSITDANDPNDTVPLTIDSVQVVAGATAGAIVNFGTPVDSAPAGGTTA